MKVSLPWLLLVASVLGIALIGDGDGYAVYVPVQDSGENGGDSGGDSGGNSGGNTGGNSGGNTGGNSGGNSGGGDGPNVHRVGQSCVYDIEDTLELCHLETARQKVRFELIRGPGSCERYVIKEMDCIGCKYVPNQNYGDCVNGHTFKHEELVPGSKGGCPEKRKITKECIVSEEKTKKTDPNLQTVFRE